MVGSLLLGAFSLRGCPVRKYGQGNGAWDVARGSLDSKSVVISAGVGKDISFDLEVNKAHACRVIMIDPSPTGRQTIEQSKPLPPGLVFESIGIADRDENISFASPYHPDEGSFRLPTNGHSSPTNTFRCERIATLMRRHALNSIDLLKIDIEGFEYGVLRDLLKTKCKVGQICVEFHHGIVPGIRKGDSLRAILRLAAAGYRLISRDQLNYTFLRRKQHHTQAHMTAGEKK
jgi:FkbM family methyltransferase